MENEFKLDVYHKFLIRESKKDRRTLAGMIRLAHAKGTNELIKSLVALTGDESYNRKTFYKAADLLLEADAR